MVDSSTIIQEKINVFCRLKPINQQQRSESSCIRSCPDDGTCKYIKRSHDENEIPQEIVFPIRCFDQESHQEEIFHGVAKTICDSVIRGYNGTIMAYGPTNSGKTYTMRGDDSLQEIGIIPRCMQYILSKVYPDTIVMASYLQIYCENISDLLDPNFNDSTNVADIESDNYKSNDDNNNNNNSSSPLQLRETMGRVYVEGLSSYAVNNIHDLQDILRKGDERRKTSSTNANLTSSRSHAILIIKVCQQQSQTNNSNSKAGTDTTGGVMQQQQQSQQSTLVLCDLAGSERATASAGLNFMRLEEAKAINLSLSALGNCMNALAEGKVHIPYRDSKLTRLLSNSLGGGSRTSIIVTVIPGEDRKGEYLNTLRFASRASKVKVVANLVRYVDFEKLYNDTQKQLDEWEQEKRNKAILLEEIQSVVEIKSNEIDMLHDEIRELKSQLKLSSINSNKNNNSNNGGGTESDSNNNHNSDNNTNTNKSVCSSIECESLRKQIITEHTIEIEKLRQSFNTKIKKEQSIILTLEQEIQELSIDLKHERENHLSTINDMKRINEIKNQIEIQCQERIQEMYSELDNKNTMLDQKNEVIEQYQHQANNNKSSSSSSSSNGQDNNYSDDDMISKSKMIEMEQLFMITVERLSHRLHQLEMSKTNGKTINSNSSNTNNNISRQQSQSLGSSSSSGSQNNLLNNSNINNGKANHSSSSKHPLKKALDYSNGR